MMHSSFSRNDAGFTLLEVLISLLLLSFMILVLMKSQHQVLRQAKKGYQRAIVIQKIKNAYAEHLAGRTS